MDSVEKILLDLKRKIFKPVYFLAGEEAYYIDLISDYIEQNTLNDADKEFNQYVVYGREIDLAGVLSLAKQFPMMSERQVVIVKEAQNISEFSKEKGESAKKANSPTQQFIQYLQTPQPTTVLVFAHKHKSIDKRGAIAKALQKHALFAEFSKLYDNKIPEWIGNYVKDKEYSIGPKASFLLAEFLGNNLSKIANELQKLFINLEKGKEISIELIQKNVGISKDYNIFELQDAIGKKDILKTNRILNYFSENEKEHPLILTVITLYGYFTKILRYHFLADKSKTSAASALGVNPYFIEGYARAAGNYSIVKLKNIFLYLKEVDLKSKGIENNSIENKELMKELFFKILH
ncbi:MAG: DNA polymerase III subunit delta [Bacteroidetes bacterium]|nr:DNA polymerase III subunit delta [Bacteroidota bacterium]